MQTVDVRNGALVLVLLGITSRGIVSWGGGGGAVAARLGGELALSRGAGGEVGEEDGVETIAGGAADSAGGYRHSVVLRAPEGVVVDLTGAFILHSVCPLVAIHAIDFLNASIGLVEPSQCPKG